MHFGRFHHRPRAHRQKGYVLLVLMLMAALVLVGLSVELPAIGAQIRRDREEELIHRGAQYARAIKRYYIKFRAYPVSLDQLQNTNNIRFLRKKYKDPMTGQDFRLLRFGDVQLSFKGAGASTGPGVAPVSGAFGSAGLGQTGQPQPGFGQSGSAQPGQSQPASATAGPQPLSAIGGKGPTFGGGPIIGVASTSEKASFHVFNEKDHYKDWEFIYDPTQDRGNLIRGPYNGTQLQAAGAIPGAVTPGQMNPQQKPSSPFGTPAFGQGPGGTMSPTPSPQPAPR
jgi:type II secretory pathway pseudopilin PulG